MRDAEETVVHDVIIVGGGPAGLSLAEFLRRQYKLQARVLEASERVGGRCLSEDHSGHIVEYGTCYAITAHTDVHRWLHRFKQPKKRMTDQTMDNRPLMAFVNAGEGAPLPFQVIAYLRARGRLMRRLSKQDPVALKEAGQPVLDWLRTRNLGKVERLMYRTVTTMGYGFLSEVSTLQALRWVDHHMFITGALKQTYMPTLGWQALWDRLAESLDVQTQAKVVKIDRSDHENITLDLSNGAKLACKKLVTTLPLDDFIELTEPTEKERTTSKSIQWNGYAMSLCAVSDWFTKEQMRTWSVTADPHGSSGKLFVARREHFEEELGGQLYALGQSIGPYSGPELAELAERQILEDGGRAVKIIRQKLWRYFPRYLLEDIQDGLPYLMEDMQGERSTYYTGASYSHEAVSSICNFNRRLAKRIVGDLRSKS